MKTLIINGSPRENGDTAALVAHLREHLLGEVKIVSVRKSRISPCMDCRTCRRKPGCVITDDMQEIYEYLKTCDNVVIASPVHFSELTGQLLNVASRLQTYYSARYFRNEEPLLSRKKGAVILAGGGTGNPNKAYDTAVSLLHYMNAHEVFPMVCSANTDRLPAAEDRAALRDVRRAAEFLSSP